MAGSATGSSLSLARSDTSGADADPDSFNRSSSSSAAAGFLAGGRASSAGAAGRVAEQIVVVVCGGLRRPEQRAWQPARRQYRRTNRRLHRPAPRLAARRVQFPRPALRRPASRTCLLPALARSWQARPVRYRQTDRRDCRSTGLAPWLPAGPRPEAIRRPDPLAYARGRLHRLRRRRRGHHPRSGLRSRLNHPRRGGRSGLDRCRRTRRQARQHGSHARRLRRRSRKLLLRNLQGRGERLVGR